MNAIPLEQLTMATFSRCVNSHFRVWVGAGQSVEMKLAEVTTPPGAASHPGVECFSVIFAGPAAPLLPQRIYTFENDNIGRFDLFVVPITQDAGGIRYQAAFNRLIRRNQPG
jgi:hypothetical protein